MPARVEDLSVNLQLRLPPLTFCCSPFLFGISNLFCMPWGGCSWSKNFGSDWSVHINYDPQFCVELADQGVIGGVISSALLLLALTLPAIA